MCTFIPRRSVVDLQHTSWISRICSWWKVLTRPSLQEIQLTEHLWIGAKEIGSIYSPLSAYYCLVWLRRVWMLSGQLLWATLFNILRSGLDAFGTNYFDNTVWHPPLHFITIYPYGGWYLCNQQRERVLCYHMLQIHRDGRHTDPSRYP